MKQLISIAFAALLLSSCKKEINNSVSSQQQFAQVNSKLHPVGVILDDPSLIEKVGYYSMPQNSLNKATLASYVDLSMYMPEVGYQGTQLSCVGWAVGYYCKTYQEGREKKWGVDQNAYSPSWIYNQINLGRYLDIDSGSRVSDAMDLLVANGCDFIDNFPYYSYNYTTLPSTASKTNAAHYHSFSWKYLTKTADNLKAILASSQVLVIAIPVYPDFDSLSSDNEIYDDWSDTSRGDHAICIIGYDDSKQAFKFINSWGTGYGINGYGWIAYDKIPDIHAAYVLTDNANSYDTKILLGDFNGDKVQDILTANGHSFYVSWSGVNGLKELKSSTQTISELAIGDFNGDGKSDIFYPNGTKWYVSYSGTGIWYVLSSSSKKDNLKLGDFNGDGKSDVFYRNGSGWYVSYSGTGTLTKINSSSIADNITIGDFNGDGKSDVFYTSGFGWFVSYSGTGTLTNINSSSVTDNIALGDFNGDGKSDVFYTNGSEWNVCYSGIGGFVKLNTSSLRVSELQLANYDTGRFGDNKYDVFHATSSKWEISRSGTSTFSAL